MGSKTGIGVLPILVVGGAVVLLGPQLVPGFPDLLGDLGGQTATEYQAAPGTKPRTDKCTADQLLKQRQCDDVKVVLIDAAKMPFIASNIIAAWSEGKPFLMHKDAPGTDDAKRSVVCGSSFKKQFAEGSCDEYVFASTVEGGRWANVRVQEVPLREQKCQGGTLRQEYRRAGIVEGCAFIVVITNPAMVATTPYAGVDIAKDQSCQS
ncbi:NucA/NucB deoxyribonuclease domain-containing protein [Lentzea sp. NPDC102401]|uniref:NucA/NucB deoxyribonuclease domain-containing protein n=1 Tax=Lentzea sp. NPDC102401 TaxID=3364128 RepID=UPI00380BD163